MKQSLGTVVLQDTVEIHLLERSRQWRTTADHTGRGIWRTSGFSLLSLAVFGLFWAMLFPPHKMCGIGGSSACRRMGTALRYPPPAGKADSCLCS